MSAGWRRNILPGQWIHSFEEWRGHSISRVRLTALQSRRPAEDPKPRPSAMCGGRLATTSNRRWSDSARRSGCGEPDWSRREVGPRGDRRQRPTVSLRARCGGAGYPSTGGLLWAAAEPPLVPSSWDSLARCCRAHPEDGGDGAATAARRAIGPNEIRRCTRISRPVDGLPHSDDRPRARRTWQDPCGDRGSDRCHRRHREPMHLAKATPCSRTLSQSSPISAAGGRSSSEAFGLNHEAGPSVRQPCSLLNSVEPFLHRNLLPNTGHCD